MPAPTGDGRIIRRVLGLSTKPGWTGKDALIAFGVALVAALMMFPYWGPPTAWETDGLFYEAQKFELEGEPSQAARREVFASHRADVIKEDELDIPVSERTADNPEWVEYSSQFYRRRWVIPAAAAAVEPLFGSNSLETIALFGYVVSITLLYLLLRRRFSMLISLGVALACLLLPPVRLVAAEPGTDSWGLALLIAGLIAASFVLDGRRRWLIPWVGVILVGSFTRDMTIVLVLAVAFAALFLRTRPATELTVSGLLASVPAPLMGGAPFRENLAYVMNDYREPADSSWGYVLGHYPGQLFSVVRDDVTYPFHFAFFLPVLVAMLAIFAGWIALIVVRRIKGDPYFQLLRGSLVGGIASILVSVNFTTWRLELVLLPAAAVGIALLAQGLEVPLYERIAAAGRAIEERQIARS